MKMKEKEYDVLMFEARRKQMEMKKVIKRYDRIRTKRFIRSLTSLSCFKRK